MTFLPEDYKVPQSSNYMKLQEGENTFRVLSSAITGFEYWTADNKPVRLKEFPKSMPDNVRTEDDGTYRVKHFWAFVVYNYEAQKIQILQLTQKSIMKTIKAYVDNKKWGDPKEYDITITRSGSGLETEYQVIADPHSAIDENILTDYREKKIHLDALFDGKDPFE